MVRSIVEGSRWGGGGRAYRQKSTSPPRPPELGKQASRQPPGGPLDNTTAQIQGPRRLPQLRATHPPPGHFPDKNHCVFLTKIQIPFTPPPLLPATQHAWRTLSSTSLAYLGFFFDRKLWLWVSAHQSARSRLRRTTWGGGGAEGGTEVA